MAAVERRLSVADGRRRRGDEKIPRAESGTAVEINSRPERLDPPRRLLSLAVEFRCEFAVATDAHAPGRLDRQRVRSGPAYPIDRLTPPGQPTNCSRRSASTASP